MNILVVSPLLPTPTSGQMTGNSAKKHVLQAFAEMESVPV